MRAAGTPAISTVSEPLAMVSGGPTQVQAVAHTGGGQAAD